MRLLPSVLIASALALSPLACKRDNGPGEAKRPADTTTQRPKGPKMPRPLKLPADPRAVVHVDVPKALLNNVLAYAGSEQKPKDVLQEAAAASNMGIAKTFVPHLGLGRAWNMAQVDDQTIIHVPIRKASVAKVAALLSSMKPVGEFGAVDLGRPAGEPGPTIAFFDQQNMMLTLANDLRGIATGPELGRAYGKQGINISINKAQAARYGAQLPVKRVRAQGKSLDDLLITLEGVPQTQELEILHTQIGKGALTGLLDSPQIALGGTSTYRNYKQNVDSIISQAKRTTSKQSFLIRGNFEDMTKRLSSMLRSWNGRVMAGVGPANHVTIGMGSDDPARMSKSTLFFIRGAIDNIKTAKTFGIGGIPNVRFQPNASKAGGEPIHVVSLDRARGFVPSDLHGLLDESGRLRIAMAFPSNRGAGMIVLGPKAPDVLTKWVGDTKNATPPGKSSDHLLAATLAIGPKKILSLVQSKDDPRALLSTNANRPPTKLVVRKEGDTYTIRLRKKAGAKGGKPRNATP